MNKTAFITGASSVIGEAYAQSLARDRFELHLVASRDKLFKKIAFEPGKSFGVKIKALHADLIHREDVERLEDFIKEKKTLSLIVNNAGFSTGQRFIESDIES